MHVKTAAAITQHLDDLSSNTRGLSYRIVAGPLPRSWQETLPRSSDVRTTDVSHSVPVPNPLTTSSSSCTAFVSSDSPGMPLPVHPFAAGPLRQLDNLFPPVAREQGVDVWVDKPEAKPVEEHQYTPGYSPVTHSRVRLQSCAVLVTRPPRIEYRTGFTGEVEVDAISGRPKVCDPYSHIHARVWQCSYLDVYLRIYSICTLMRRNNDVGHRCGQKARRQKRFSRNLSAFASSLPRCYAACTCRFHMLHCHQLSSPNPTAQGGVVRRTHLCASWMLLISRRVTIAQFRQSTQKDSEELVARIQRKWAFENTVRATSSHVSSHVWSCACVPANSFFSTLVVQALLLQAPRMFAHALSSLLMLCLCAMLQVKFFSNVSDSDLARPIRVQFEGEDASDLGGPAREWARLVSSSMVLPHRYSWLDHQKNHTCTCFKL
jgi:hypothetical protein